MKTSLKPLLLSAVILPAALLATVISMVFIAFGLRALDTEFEERGLGIVSFLAPAAEYGLISGNRPALDALAFGVLEQRDVVAIAFFDAEVRPLVQSGRLSSTPQATLSEVNSPVILGKHGDRMVLAAPVMALPLAIDDLMRDVAALDDTSRIGWTVIELDTQSLERSKQDMWFRTLLVTALALSVTAWLATSLAGRFSDVIARLAGAVDALRAGRLDIVVEEASDIRELRTLQQGFNQMARSISESRATLQARVDEATAQLAHLALHDPLTGLPNRRAFEQALDDAVILSRRAGDRDALCFIDLDRFKIVNDTAGHAAGDELLRQVGELIRKHVRASDHLYRIGGDEFVLILRGCGQEEARKIAENLREAVSTLKFDWEGTAFTIGASIGLVRILGEDKSAADILVAADLACYAAKKGGRNQVHEPAAAADSRD